MGFSAKIRDFMGYPEDDYEDPGFSRGRDRRPLS